MFGSDLSSLNLSSWSSARGVVVTDINNNIRYLDTSICKLLGVDLKAVCHNNLFSVLRNNLKSRLNDPDRIEVIASFVNSNPYETIEDVIEITTPERQVIYWYSTSLMDANGDYTGRVEVFSDITRRRQIEDTNIGMYMQMISAYKELKSAQEKLVQSEKLRAIGEISSGVAHDFNNSLAIILGNVQLLLGSINDPKMNSRLEAIEQAALDSAETVRRIREFTKIHPDEPFSPIDLNLIISKVVEMLEPNCKEFMHSRDCQLDVVTNLQPGVFATGNASEIREVITNILLNAVQAMPNGGTITISTGWDESQVWVKVVDTGIGMSDEVIRRAFDPFFTTKGVEGTGLGLSVTYGIIKQHNGRIDIQSHLNQGSVVSIFLPGAFVTIIDDYDVSVSSQNDTNSLSILIVDDEQKFSEVLSDMLSAHGHIVKIANRGTAAIQIFSEESFDLVITDLGMPEMSGWQVAKKVKDIKPDTPVILLTGWGTRVDEEMLVESGIDLVVSKPVKMADITSIIDKILK